MEHIAAKEDKIVIKQLASTPSTGGLKNSQEEGVEASCVRHCRSLHVFAAIRLYRAKRSL